MKYALIASDGFILDIIETDPYIPFFKTSDHIELTEEQITKIEQNGTNSYIIDNVVYSSFEFVEKNIFETNPDQFKILLRKRIANSRYLEEISGIMFNGYKIKTDRITQSILGNARQMASGDSSFSIDWKVDDKTFITLNSVDIIALSNLMVEHVQRLFSKEKELNDLINASNTFEDFKNIKW